MTEKQKDESNALRDQAKGKLQEPLQPGAGTSDPVRRMIQELQIHQVELEIQNEELIRVHAELDATRNKYFDLFNLAPVGYLTLSEESVILDANLTAAKLLGVPRGGLLANALTQFILHEDQDIYYLRRKALFDTGAPQKFELRLKNKEENFFYAGFKTKRILENGAMVCLAVIIDITQRKHSEAALVEAKELAEAANQAKNQFIAVLSHELRTPLTPVLATVGMLQMQPDLPKDLQADLEMIRRNVEIEVALIADLLDTTRIGQGKVVLQQETVDIHDCLKSAVEIDHNKIQEKQQLIRFQFEASSSLAWGDPIRLRQAFWNLLKNAVKFTPNGGRITLTTRNIGDRLEIEISDTGIGIEPEILPRIFNPFEQGERGKIRQFGGLGLGLHIARNVVELHQGRLSAFSLGKDQGTTFTVELPTIHPRKKMQQLPLPWGPETRSLRVLLVEDNPDNLLVFVKILKMWGHVPTPAENVTAALELASQQEFDLLITDLGLPDGSGMEVMRALKKRSSIPCIALSGFATEDDIQQSLTAGFAYHLVKPVNLAALKRAIVGR